MTNPFPAALAFVLHEEGGYVNDPLDPGGVTNLGVTKARWDEWTGQVNTIANMRALTPAKVTAFYRAKYWNALQCDYLPGALALCAFDFGVNSGISRAARYLQGEVGAKPDGHIGSATLKAVEKYVAANGLAETVVAYVNARRAYLRSLSTFSRFGKGWLRRCTEVETEAMRGLI